MSLGRIEDRVVEAFPPDTATLAKNAAVKGQKVWAICGQAHRSDPIGFVLCVFEGILEDVTKNDVKVRFGAEPLAKYPRGWVLGQEIPGMVVVPHDATIESVAEDPHEGEEGEDGQQGNDQKGTKRVTLTVEEVRNMATEFYQNGGLGLVDGLNSFSTKTLQALSKGCGLAVHTSKGRDHLLLQMKKAMAIPPVRPIFAEEPSLTFQTDLESDLATHQTHAATQKDKRRRDGTPKPRIYYAPSTYFPLLTQLNTRRTVGERDGET